jgi:exopolysaccharide biosynthesis polyprenyl glycosylphosphotransferase
MSGGFGDSSVAISAPAGAGGGPAGASLSAELRRLSDDAMRPSVDSSPASRSAASQAGTGVVAEPATGAFAAWCRTWGFHVEVLLSVAVGLLALFSARDHTKVAVVVLATWAVVNFHKGRAVTSPLPRQLRMVGNATLLPLAAVAACVGFFRFPAEVVPPATAGIVAGAAVSALCRVARWRLQSPVRVLLVGDRVAIAEAASRWGHAGRVNAVAAVLVEPDLTPEDIPDQIMGVPMVNGLSAAPAMVERWNVDLVVVSPGPGFTSTDFRRLAWALENTRVSLGVMGVLDSVAPHRITPGLMNGATVTDVRLPRAPRLVAMTKSALEGMAGAVLLVLVSPLLVAMVVAVRLDSPGRAIFTQTRVGRHGRHFKVYKMRTMVDNADAIKSELADDNEYDGLLFKLKRDPRITRVGSLLRKSSLDELPQLFNVVKGDMSLVGPRPALPAEVAQMDSDTLRRLAVRPGITGLWQVSGRSDLAWDQAVALDTYYADNWTLGGDVSICVRTVKAVVAAKGAY